MKEKTLTIPDSILIAENMKYDNSNSGLNATNAQAAIDEIQNQTLNALYFDETLEISGPVATPLTTQHIVDNVESDASNKVLSAKQGKVLNARISNIIANNNDTDGNDELVDMRIDVNGVAHDSAGDAVRSQVSKLSSEIANVNSEVEETNSLFVVGGHNLFNPHDLMLNHAYKADNGDLVENTKYKCTPLIPIDKSFGCVHSSVKTYRVTWYDENKDYLLTMGSINNAWVKDVPNAKYFACTYLIDDDLSNLMLTWLNGKNTTNVEYEPFLQKLNNEKVKSDVNYNIDSNTFLDMARNSKMCILNTNETTGITECTFSATQKTTHIQEKFPCMPCKLLVLEFMGKATDISYSSDYSSGGMFVIEFFDKNDNIIGDKYNGYVLGYNRCGYHRYGYVAPLGTAYAQLRLVTRGTTSITVHDVTITCMDAPTPNHNRGIKLDGHLGSILVAPKNTLPAFELGRIANFSNMITNCNMTKDGVLVALHDNTIDATSDGTGNVSDYTYEELQAFDFGSWFSPVYTGTKIPKLEDVVKTISMCGMGLIYRAHDSWYNAERESEVKQVYSWVKKYGQIGKASVKSFSTAVLDYIYTIMGNDVDYIYCGTYKDSTLTWAENFGGKVCIELNYGSMTEEIATDIINAGFEVSVYILNDIAKMKELVNIGVTRFCTDTYGDIIFPFD